MNIYLKLVFYAWSIGGWKQPEDITKYHNLVYSILNDCEGGSLWKHTWLNLCMFMERRVTTSVLSRICLIYMSMLLEWVINTILFFPLCSHCVVIYDNACKLHAYCLNKVNTDPIFFPKYAVFGGLPSLEKPQGQAQNHAWLTHRFANEILAI